MPHPINLGAAGVDLGDRFFQSTAVAASPSGTTETTVCTLTVTGDLAFTKGVFLFGAVAYTVAGSGTAVTYKLRQTGTSGTTIFTTGATTAGITAGNLVAENIQGFDASPVLPGQVYVLTVTVTGGSGASTVSAANLFAIVV